MKKTLIYVTSVNLSDQSAQSMQIKSMSFAFYSLLSDKFKLLGFGVPEDCSNFGWSAKAIIDKKILRTLILLLKIVFFKSKKNTAIFTRDFYVSFVLGFLGYSVIWEIHQKPSNKVKGLLTYICRNNNFKILSISKSLLDTELSFIENSVLYSYHDCVDNDFINDVELLKDNQLFSQYANKVALYTGALHKGQDIDSLEPLFLAYPEWNFIIIGGKPTEVMHYKRQFANYQNVYLLGRKPKEDIVKFQMSADCLLYPLTKSNSLWRYTSPLKLFEYLATGKPIVASCIGSITEILNSKNAFLYNENKSIVDAFYDFSNTKKTALLDMGLENKKLIKEFYLWDKRCNYILEEIY